ncbi:hypothetical protein [Lactiplantibacillus herbarum]|uniref:hypothetical protein n=1 Tax=Lactiplantibacillus herbarum TaxID=1670446 RepID=UPI00064F4C96|nr:hypothetical protein [Lactiplantibacillus herbarum]
MHIKLLKFIKNYPTYTLMLVFSVFSIISDQIFPHQNFHLYLLLLLSMFLLECLALSTFKKEIKALRSLIDTLSTIELLGRLDRLTYLKHPYFFYSVVASSNLIFMFTIWVNNLVEHSLTGIFGVGIGVITFSVGIKAYGTYLAYLSYLNDVPNLSFKVEYSYQPANSDVYKLMARIIYNLNFLFFLIGLLYTILYSIMTRPFITLKLNPLNIEITALHPLILKFTWIAIFMFFILGFPILASLSNICLRHIIRAQKDAIIFPLKLQLEKINVLKKPELANTLLSLMSSIDKTADVPNSTEQKYFLHYFNFLISSITFIVPILSLLLGKG